MKTLSKVLCLLMVAAMCMSLFGASASAFSLSIGSGSYESNGSDGFSFPIGEATGDVGDDLFVPDKPVVDGTPADDEASKPAAPAVKTEGTQTGETANEANEIEKAIAEGKTSVTVEDAVLDKEIEINGTLKLTVLNEVKNADKLVVKGELTVTGEGYMDKLPTVKDGGKLVITGCEFPVNPKAYVPAGYSVIDGITTYAVIKDEGNADADNQKLPDTALTGKLTVTDEEYTQATKNDTPIEATFTANAAETNFDHFAVVSTKASTVTDKDIIADSNYDLKYSGTTGTVTLKPTYLDGLEPGSYWLVGLVIENGSKAPLYHGYSDKTFEIKAAENATPGPGASNGMTVTVYDSKYNVYNCWKSGYGALNFYYTPAYNITSMIVTDLNDTVNLTVNNEQWRDLGNGYFYLGESQILNKLSSGTHTLTINAVDAKGSPVAANCTFNIKQVPTLSVLNSSKHVINSAQNLKFVSTTPISEVWVGNKRLDNVEYEMYKLSDGGKTLTLTAQFLNNRTAGNSYYLKTVDNAGEESNVVTFQILTTAQANASVSTGDTSNIALWTAFLVLSGAAAAVALPKLKKMGGKD